MTLMQHEECYVDHTTGTTMYREWGTSPNGNDYHGAWVLRVRGVYVDHSRNRTDLAAANKLKLPSAYL